MNAVDLSLLFLVAPEYLTPVCGSSPPTTLFHESESYVESTESVVDMRSDADVQTPPRARSASYTSCWPTQYGDTERDQRTPFW